MLEREIDYFLSNRKTLAVRYPEKYIVIKGTKVLGSYDTHAEAYNETIKEHAVGSFIIENLKTVKSK